MNVPERPCRKLDEALNEYFANHNVPIPAWSVGKHMTIEQWEEWFAKHSVTTAATPHKEPQ